MHSRQKILLALAVAATAVGPTIAGPNNGTVISGNATIQGPGTNSVVVNQTSQNAIINWQTFNIGNGERVQILMPNATSAELDRVTGNLGPSQIYGSLSSNGRVFLVNPNGILFGQGAQINVGSLLATTNDIKNADFMAGRYNFTIPGNPSASIVNQGTITAQTGGFAALVAPGVRNTGTITAWLGRVGLASANTFALDLYGDRLIQLNVEDSIASQVIDVSTGQPLKSLVSNEGKLKANGGTVQLTAAAAREVVDSVINNTGVIEANSIGTHNGMIVLSAATAEQKPAGAPTQTVTVSGKLSAAGRRKGTTGGTVVIAGENTALNSTTIDASGNAGGGTVLIGGNGSGANGTSTNASSASGSSGSVSGGNGSSGTFGAGSAGASGNGGTSSGNSNSALASQIVSNASTVTIDAATVIDASATVSGNGGKVTVWSDLATAFYGTILAQGGAQSGNGGFVETSGGTLAFIGTVNTSAPNGKTGTWLLDPVDLTIDAASAASISSSLANNDTNVRLMTTENGASGPGVQSSGAGNITINAPISWSSNSTLTIDAYNAIIFNASINVMGGGGLVLTTFGTNSVPPAVPLISFGNAASVQFTGTEGSGQSLTINNESYALLYSMSEVQKINNNLLGNYALALPLNVSGGTNWTPIGTNSDGTILNSGNGFTGSFQGLGNAISNLTINQPSASNVGLFGVVGLGGVMENVNLFGANVTGAGNVGTLIGFNGGTVTNAYTTGLVNVNILDATASSIINAGGLIGANYGSISNSSATAALNIRFASASTTDEVGTINAGGLVGANAGSIASSSADGSVSVNIVGSGSSPIDVDTAAGGLVGNNGGSITSSVANVPVSITGTNIYSDTIAGGFVGANFGGSIANSYAVGSVAISLTGASASDDTGVNAGGLVGYNNASVTNTYATGLVSVGLTNAGPGVVTSAGGLVGYNDTNGTVSSSFWDTTTTGQPSSGVGVNFGSFSATGLTTAQFGNVATFTAAGWNFGTTPGGPSCGSGGACWVIIDGDGSLNNAGGAAGATRPVLLSSYSTTITNPLQLELVNLDLTANYTLASNINFAIRPSEFLGPNGSGGFVPIGSNVTSFTGTFNGNGNTISGLIINQASSSFLNSVGLFGTVGFGGVVENVGLVGGSVTGGALNFGVGALVGANFGTVSTAYSTSVVSSSLIDVSLGGLVGENFGNISQSYATGPVNAGDFGFAGGLVGANFATISRSYATGAVTVGAVGTAGGLVGINDTVDANGNAIAVASITDSYAKGTVFSSGVDAWLGGLVGENTPLAVISNSQAYGNVTAMANLQAVSNCISGCEYANAGGFVGVNYGTITGASWLTAPTNCAASFTCATGVVSVGSQGQGGGFAGFNQGIITNAFALGNVSGAGGQPSVNGVFNNVTQLGGFVGDNQGMISNAFAIGNVGTAGTPYLSVAGFAGSNEGIISNASATGNVSAGDSSTAGGFVGSNSPNESSVNCSVGCIIGDGYKYYNDAAISSAQAYGNVTVGASSVAGGFASNSCGGNCDSGGSFTNVTASGAVSAGHDSIVGGLVGVVGLNSTLTTNSSAQNLAENSSVSAGSNSIVGGVAGVNFGTISNTTSSAPVSGGADSYIGGVAGINLGVINSVTIDPQITATGGNDFIGGIAGLNVGSINGSTAQVAIASGPSSYVGGLAGLNGSYSNEPYTILDSSFPNGIITNSSASGSGFSGNVGAQVPSFTPTPPAWLSNCTDGICSVLLNGSLQPGNNPNPNPNPNPTPTPNSPPPTLQTTQLTQTVNFTNSNNTPPPVITLVDINNVTNGGPGNGGTNGGNGNGGNGNGGNGNGGNGNGNGGLANGKHGGNGAPPGVRLIDLPHMPLPPGSGLPPLNETRFLSNQLVLQFDTNNLTPQQISALAARFGLTIIAQQTIGMLGRTVYTFSISNGRSVRDLIRLIDASGLKVAVQPQYLYRFTQDGSAADQGETSDPAQYIVQKLQLAAAHRISKGENVVIAVIDSAIDAEQPDFVGGVVDRYDAGCGSTAPDAHGTGMAGAIASHVQLVGVAPSAKIIAICAFGGAGGSPEATSVKIIRGLDYAVEHGAKIVNMSFAGPYDPALAQALQVAREKGILIVAAAGNAGAKSPPLYPGADPNVLAVTATDEDDRLFAGANQGKYVALAAPGVNILVPAPNGGVQMTTGTSVATANVSGVAALLVAEKPSRTPEELRALMVATAKHLGTTGVNPQFGAGLVDPVRALEAVPPVAGGKSAAAAPAGRVQ